MASHLRNILSAAVAVCLLSFGQASDANASIFYNWSGDCKIGCSGTSTATLELKDSYEGGKQLRKRHFVSFAYKSSGGQFKVPGDARFQTISGRLPAKGESGGANLYLGFKGFNFQITLNGGGWGSIFKSAGIYEGGRGSTWSNGGGGTHDLPAPASLLTLIGALLALAFVWRRRQPAAGVPAAA